MTPESHSHAEVHRIDGGPATALIVANGGVGPAKIEAFELFWKGCPMHNAHELIEACCLAAEARSVFDECWTSDLRTLQPARVARCEAPKVPFRSE